MSSESPYAEDIAKAGLTPEQGEEFIAALRYLTECLLNKKYGLDDVSNRQRVAP